MSKSALKFLLITSTLPHRQGRPDWVWRMTVFGTVVTVGLIALYLMQRGPSG
jgi:hypothetical protein